MHRPLVWTLNAFAIAIYTRLIKHDSDMPTTMQRKATHCVLGSHCCHVHMMAGDRSQACVFYLHYESNM